MGVVDVVTIVQKTDNIELVKQVLSLQAEALAMQAENQGLRERTRELEQALDFAKGLRLEAPFYLSGDDRAPYCARCRDVDRRGVHLTGAWKGRRWECFQCGRSMCRTMTEEQERALEGDGDVRHEGEGS